MKQILLLKKCLFLVSVAISNRGVEIGGTVNYICKMEHLKDHPSHIYGLIWPHGVKE